MVSHTLRIWTANIHSFQNRQRIESCLMQVWVKSHQEILHFMEVQLNCSLKIQICDIRHIKRTPYIAEFQVILKGETFLKVEWVVRKDQEELLLPQLIVSLIVQRRFKREHKHELQCSINLSPSWIQYQKKIMRMIWQLIFLSKNKEMGRSIKCHLTVHIKRDLAPITWKLMMNRRYTYLHEHDFESFKTKFIYFIQIWKKLIFRTLVILINVLNMLLKFIQIWGMKNWNTS